MPAALAVLLLIVLAALPAPASAGAYRGTNGAIAFVGTSTHPPGDAVLYVRRGGRTISVLRGDAPGDPAWSPAGQRLALTREVPDVGRAVWIMQRNATGLRQLTAPEQAGAQPTWAPGGRRLAYTAGATGERRIHLIGADGRGDVALTSGPRDQHDPQWSRRDKIAFVGSTSAGEEIFTIPARGGSPRRLTFKPGDDADPVWSPSGGQIAYVRGTGGIWVMSPYGRGKRPVLHVPGGVEQGVSWSPDGRRILFAGGPPGARRVYSVRPSGRGLRALSLASSNGEDPDWASGGHDPVIGAAGDIACSPTGRSFNEGLGRGGFCRMAHTSDLLLQSDLAAVLVLGDEQYEQGELANFEASFGPSWGRLGALLRPVPGNHEYRDPGAGGYWDYFNGAGVQVGHAGDRARGGYYSFDVGTWHVVALDSNCPLVPGGCEVGSPQQAWLENDLRTHPRRCTLAYWHHPLFSSRASEEGRGSLETQALWQTLRGYGADVVLNGHQHFYERLAPQDGYGTADPSGLRAFVVGTGGKSLDQADFRDHNSQAFSADAYGVLELRLHPRGYEWDFRSFGSEAYYDRGHDDCH